MINTPPEQNIKDVSNASSVARGLGYNSLASLKQALSERRGAGLKGRLESGEGVLAAVTGTAIDQVKTTTKKLSPKRAAKKFYNEFFGGDDILSAYMRGKLRKHEIRKENKKEKKELEKKENSPTPEKEVSKTPNSEGNIFLKMIAKNSLFLSHISKDINVLRQNIEKLFNLENSKIKEEKKQAVITNAKNYFLKQDEAERKLEQGRERLTTDKSKPNSPIPLKKESGGFLSIISDFLPAIMNGLVTAFGFLFNPMNLLKIFGKVFLIGTLFASLFKGISSAFEKWKETGSIKESLIAGLGSILDLLTFGIFGEDTVRKISDTAGKYIDKMTDIVVNTLTSIKDWVANNIYIPKIPAWNVEIPESLRKTVGFLSMDKVKVPEKVSIGPFGPYYPFKQDHYSTTPQTTTVPTHSEIVPREVPKETKVKDNTKSQEKNIENITLKLDKSYGLNNSPNETPIDKSPTIPLKPEEDKENNQNTSITPSESPVPNKKKVTDVLPLETDIDQIKPISSHLKEPEPKMESSHRGYKLNKISIDVADKQRREQEEPKNINAVDSSVTNNSQIARNQDKDVHIEVYDITFSKYYMA